MTPLVLKIHLFGLSVGLSVFGLFLGLGGGVGAAVVALAGRRAGVSTRTVLALCFWSAAAGILAARVGGLVAGGHSHGLPLAMSYVAGLAAALGAALLCARLRELPSWQALDLLACGLAAAHAVAVLGCFAAGCCYGRTASADAPFAARFGQGTVAWHELAERGLVPLSARATPPLYAVQALEAAALTLLTVMLLLYARRPRGGRVLGGYLIGAAAIWLALAPWRAQAWQGAIGIAGLAAAGIALTLREHAQALASRAARPARRV